MKRRIRSSPEDQHPIVRLNSAIQSLRGSCKGKSEAVQSVLRWHIHRIRRWKDHHWSPRSPYALYETYSFLEKAFQFRKSQPETSGAIMKAFKTLNPRVHQAFLNSQKRSPRQIERERLYHLAKLALKGIETGINWGSLYSRKTASQTHCET